MKRILGLDVGTKRTGIAVSDPLGLTAQAVETWEHVSRNADLERMVQSVNERKKRKSLRRVYNVCFPIPKLFFGMNDLRQSLRRGVFWRVTYVAINDALLLTNWPQCLYYKDI